jgi:hypothetical protein
MPLARAAPTPGAAPLCALLDRQPAPAQDGSGLAGDHAADARLRPLEPAVPGPAPGFARETGLDRTPAAPAEVALIVPVRSLSDALRYALEDSRDVDEGMAVHRGGRAPRFTGR